MIVRIDRKTAIGAGAIMLAAFLWSLDGTFIRPKFYEFPAALVAFLEHALGFIFLSPFIIIGWKKIRVLGWREWGAILWVAAWGGVIGTILITQAFFAAVGGEITFATVVILQKLQPVFALIMARLILKEKLKREFYWWAGLAVAAAYVLAFGAGGLDLRGHEFFHSAAFYALIAAFAFGSSTVFGKRIVNHLDFKATSALRFGLTVILILPVVIFGHYFTAIGSLKAINWAYLFLIVFTSGAGAIFLYYFGLKRVSASTSSICELFWPLSAVGLDYFINHNTLNTIQIIAAAAMLWAIYRVINTGKTKPVEFRARIISGAGRGSRLLFPTINLDRTDLDIVYGIYLAEAEIKGQIYRGALHYGQKETFDEGASLELLLREQVPISQGEEIKVKIIKFLRPIIRFDSAEKLKKQIEEDIKSIK